MLDIKHLIEASAREWDADNAPRLAAALAFYTLLSLSPAVIIVVGMAGLIFGKAAAGGQLAWEIHDVVGWNGATTIQAIIHSARHLSAGITAAALSVITLAWGASAVVVELRSGLNTIWEIPTSSTRSGLQTLWTMGKERFFSVVLVTGAGVLLAISLLASACVTAMGAFIGARLRIPESWLHTGAFLVSFLAVALLFAAIYRVIPDVRLKWSDVAVGAAATALIFTAGKQLIALYLGKAAFASSYGAAGSFVVLLIWVYYSAQLFFFGAEFTKIYARTYGSHLGRPRAAFESKHQSNPKNL